MMSAPFSDHHRRRTNGHGNGKRSARTNSSLPFFSSPASSSPFKKRKSAIRRLLKPFIALNPSFYSRAKDLAFAMGNILSLIFGGNRASTSREGASERNAGLGLGFEQYKSLLVGESSERPSDDGGRLVTRKGPDAKSVVERVPVYRRLYEEIRLRDGRLGGLEAEVKLTEEKLLGLRREDHVIDVDEEEQEENLYELFSPLTDEDEVEVDSALYGRDSHTILVTHERSNIEITKEIIRCLRPGGWLNDEVINLYLELLKERERRQPEKFLKCHFFNTFFYKKLIGGNGGYDYKAVKRWTTQKKLGYSLIDCDKIFVPVHKDIHWCLAVINVKQKSLQYLDSLGGMDDIVLRVLAKYIVDEARDKSNVEMDAHLWIQETTSLPLQLNGYDCGMFMLKYIDFFSRGMNLSFGQENMEYFRKRTVKEILRLRAE